MDGRCHRFSMLYHLHWARPLVTCRCVCFCLQLFCRCGRSRRPSHRRSAWPCPCGSRHPPPPPSTECLRPRGIWARLSDDFGRYRRSRWGTCACRRRPKRQTTNATSAAPGRPDLCAFDSPSNSAPSSRLCRRHSSSRCRYSNSRLASANSTHTHTRCDEEERKAN